MFHLASMNPKLSLNPSSLKSRFTRGFLQALMRINKQRPTTTTTTSTTSCSPKEIYQQYRRIKSAADKSMALAVRSRRAWSRAMLWKFQRQARRHLFGRKMRTCAMKKRVLEKKSTGEEANYGQANELRRLVPGGEVMDLCSLLEETAHYIKCLNAQVQVMKCIADSCTT